MDAMMAAMAAEEPAPAEAPSEEAPVDMDAMMAAMAAEEPPVAEEIPAQPETPADNLDAMLSAEVDALTEAALEETPMEVPAEEACIEPVPEEIPVEEALTEPIPEDIPTEEITTEEPPMEEIPTEEPPMEEIPTEEPPMEEIPVEDALVEPQPEEISIDQMPGFDMSQAAEVLTGGLDEIISFLDTEDYEYITVGTGENVLLLLKTADGGAMSVSFDNGEFEALDAIYSKDGKSTYSEIMNDFVKEAIKSGGGSGIKRHKGTKVTSQN